MLLNKFKKESIHRVRKSLFFKNFLVLFGGTSFAQLLQILGLFVIAYYYTPQELGILAFILSLSTILSVISTLKLEQSVLIPKKDQEARIIVVVTTMISLLISVVALLLLLIFKTWIAGLFNESKAEAWLLFVPLISFFLSAYQIFNYWTIRKKEFKRNSLALIFQSTTTVSVNAGMGYAKFGTLGLIMGSVFGRAMSFLILAIKFFDFKQRLKLNLKKKSLKRILDRYKNFPYFTMPHALFSSLGGNLPIIIITALLSSQVAGQLSMSLRIFIPLNLIAISSLQVFNQRISEKFQKEESFYMDVRRLLVVLFSVGAIPVITLAFFAPDLFSFFLGNQWVEAGKIAQILTIWFFASLMASPISYIPALLGLQRKMFLLEVMRTVLSIGGLYLGIVLKDLYTGLVLFSLGNVVVLAYNIVWIVKISYVNHQKVQNA